MRSLFVLFIISKERIGLKYYEITLVITTMVSVLGAGLQTTLGKENSNINASFPRRNTKQQGVMDIEKDSITF
jgi:hypothetical protein